MIWKEDVMARFIVTKRDDNQAPHQQHRMRIRILFLSFKIGLGGSMHSTFPVYADIAGAHFSPDYAYRYS